MEVLVLEKGSSNLGYCEFVLLYRISLVLPKTLAIELLGNKIDSIPLCLRFRPLIAHSSKCKQ